ncbi:MAG: hypothetical protein JRJ86_14590 [Deltaproteobacteria bacterium]|nr:hypothetical protein [Deltaproteobacteria bacterium]MBW2050151.1 hypothetical protein [Deltaproteobacteria bacterium]
MKALHRSTVFLAGSLVICSFLLYETGFCKTVEVSNFTELANNLTNKSITSRDGGTATLLSNRTDAPLG